MTQAWNYSDALRDILENAGKAKRFLSGVKYEDFVANDEKAYVVYHALVIIGEATRMRKVEIR